MTHFVLEYGLFLAKIATIIAALVIAAIAFFSLLANRSQTDRALIEIEKINDKFDAMRDALESEIFSKHELKALKKARKKEEQQETKTHKKRAKKEKEQPDSTRSRLFVLRFNGDMNASEVDSLRESITAIVSVAKKDDEVLVVLESAGGLVHHYGLAASELVRFRKRNLFLTVSIDLVAASGGYLMASVANKIIAAPFAVVGSIGVLAQIPNFHRFLKKYDIDVEQLTAGEHKTTLTLLGENTHKAREKFRQELEETHTLFKRFVHEHRPQLDIEKLATGEHWYGSQAIELNLVDELMTSDDYLLEKSQNTDIYQVDYVFAQTLSDKLSNLLQSVSTRLLHHFLPYRLSK